MTLGKSNSFWIVLSLSACVALGLFSFSRMWTSAATRQLALQAEHQQLVLTQKNRDPAARQPIAFPVTTTLPVWDGGGVMHPEQRIVVDRKHGWIVASLVTGRETLEWEIVLAKEQVGIVPKIEQHPVWNRSFAVSYGPYFIRDSNGQLRVLREHKNAEDKSWAVIDFASGVSGALENRAGTNGLTQYADNNKWRWLVTFPAYDGKHADCRIRFQHEELAEGQGAGGSVDGFQYTFFGQQRCQDEGDLLIAERTPSFMAEAELKLKSTIESLVGSTLPDITGRGVGDDSTRITLDELKGKVVLIDFWATWCGPCVQRLPQVEELRAKYAAQGLIVLAIHASHDSDNVAEFVKNKPVGSRVFVADRATEERFAVTSYPNYFLINRDGKIVSGFETTPPLNETLEAQLNKAPTQ